MNIFYLDEDVVKCARYHADKHVIKMILESAQILCTALGLHGVETQYKPTHLKHPCVIWAAESKDNCIWLQNLVVALNYEYMHRWDRVCDHKSALVAMPLKFPTMKFSGITERPQAMPEQYQIPNDPISAYRKYYSVEKKHLHFYTKREKPYWIL